MNKVRDFEPLNDNVLLTVLEKAPEMYKAKVIAVGPGLATLGGRLKPRVKAGDVVLINRYPATWVFLGGEKLLLVNEHRIRLKVNDDGDGYTYCNIRHDAHFHADKDAR